MPNKSIALLAAALLGGGCILPPKKEDKREKCECGGRINISSDKKKKYCTKCGRIERR